jgi:TatD DNase family protein
VNIHCHRPAAGGEVALCSQFPAEFTDPGPGPGTGWFSVGLHPWHVQATTLAADLITVTTAIASPQVLAVGEIGLDRVHGPELELQLQALQAQIRLAAARNKPLILHCVRAHAELCRLFQQLQVKVPAVIHGFNSTPAKAAALIEADFYLSFGAALLKNPRGAAADSLKKVPLERILLETDDSPVEIAQVYQAAAEILDLPIAAVAAAVSANATRLFGRKFTEK